MQKHRFVLETQMRSGTHYLLFALRVAYRPVILWPLRNGDVRELLDEDLSDGLRGREELSSKELSNTEPVALVEILFRHYYHQLNVDPSFRFSKKVALISYPFDSFFSDGVVFSSETYTKTSSSTRPEARDYVLKHGSTEWKFLYPYMQKNARWLEAIAKAREENTLVVRFEDLIDSFAPQRDRIVNFLEIKPQQNFPEPVFNRERSYWKGDLLHKFDRKALEAMTATFARSLSQFYPERSTSI